MEKVEPEGGNVMEEQKNIETVKNLFELIETGNIPAAFDILDENIYWQSPVTRTDSKYITWSKPRRSKGEVGAFFCEMNDKMEIEKFQFSDFTAQGNKVVVEGKNRGTVRSTGHEYEHDWVMIFELNNDGKIIKNLHFYDTMDLIKYFTD